MTKDCGNEELDDIKKSNLSEENETGLDDEEGKESTETESTNSE